MWLIIPAIFVPIICYQISAIKKAYTIVKQIGVNETLKFGKNYVFELIKKSFGIENRLKFKGKNISIEYDYEGKTYEILYPRSRSMLIKAENEFGENVTLKIRRRLGIGNNFHGIPTTPNDLGCEKLKIKTLKDEVVYELNDQIVL